jgi:TPR repeat protein
MTVMPRYCAAVGLLVGCLVTSSCADLPKGDGATKSANPPAALNEWRSLADQGFAEAQFILGMMYAQGQGVAQNYAEAARWFRRAAEQGDPRAQFGLGVSYDNGQGVPKDYAEAVRWYRRAAEQGNPRAQNNLGLMYELGHGVVEDYIQAHVWFSLAATQELTAAVKNRNRLEKKMTLAQILEAQILARERTTAQ